MDNWDLLIHANGRRVFPDSIGVSFIDHNLKSITDVSHDCCVPLFKIIVNSL